MKRIALLPLATVVFVACSESPVANPPVPGPQLSSVHLKGGKNAQPAYLDLVLALQATGQLSGLSNQDVFVGLEATANTTAICTNPAGAQQPPGQNPAPTTVRGGLAIPASEIKNGNTPFDVSTLAPSPNPRAAVKHVECPDDNWDFEITDLAFTSGKITVQQPQDLANPTANIVLTILCQFVPATVNGQFAIISVCQTS